MLNIKTVLHFHEILETPRSIVAILNRWAVKWPDRVIAVSKAVKDNLVAFNPGNGSKKVEIIYNGIDDVRKSVDNKDKTIILITLIGRITEAKGIWFFLDSIARLDNKVTEKCNFRIVGGAAPGKEYLIDKLKEDISNHRYSNVIKHFDFVKDVSGLLNETDILVVPSLMSDPFPTTILEGLCAGKPVIASNAGGATESIDNGISGYLVERNDTVSFANCMTELITNENLRNTMGRSARKRYEENYKVALFKNKISEFLQLCNGE